LTDTVTGLFHARTDRYAGGQNSVADPMPLKPDPKAVGFSILTFIVCSYVYLAYVAGKGEGDPGVHKHMSCQNLK